MLSVPDAVQLVHHHDGPMVNGEQTPTVDGPLAMYP